MLSQFEKCWLNFYAIMFDRRLRTLLAADSSSRVVSWCNERFQLAHGEGDPRFPHPSTRPRRDVLHAAHEPSLHVRQLRRSCSLVSDTPSGHVRFSRDSIGKFGIDDRRRHASVLGSARSFRAARTQIRRSLLRLRP